MSTAVQAVVSSQTERIRVLVAESNRMAGQMMEAVLQKQRPKFDVTTITGGSSEALRELEKNKPHVALISGDLPDGPLAGFRVLQQLRDSKSKIAPIVLLHTEDRDLFIDAFRFGARGVFTRSHSIDALPKCISAVHTGKAWVSDDQIELLLDVVSRLKPLQVVKPGGMALLSDREREVLRHVAEGMQNEEISQKMQISEHTVRNYLCRVCDKLGLSSRVELVLYALSR